MHCEVSLKRLRNLTDMLPTVPDVSMLSMCISSPMQRARYKIDKAHPANPGCASVRSNKAVAAIRSTTRNQHGSGDNNFSGDEGRSVPPAA